MAVTRAIFQFVKLVAGYSLSILHELILKYYFTTNKDKEPKMQSDYYAILLNLCHLSIRC